jgi:hypothetical protein
VLNDDERFVVMSASEYKALSTQHKDGMRGMDRWQHGAHAAVLLRGDGLPSAAVGFAVECKPLFEGTPPVAVVCMQGIHSHDGRVRAFLEEMHRQMIGHGAWLNFQMGSPEQPVVAIVPMDPLPAMREILSTRMGAIDLGFFHRSAMVDPKWPLCGLRTEQMLDQRGVQTNVI